MSAATNTPTPPNQPTQPGANQPTRAGRLLNLVRKLIDYAKQVATSLLECDPGFETDPFGTNDRTLILRRITRGLLLANALEARVISRAAYLDAGPRSNSAPHACNPRVAQPAEHRTEAAASALAELPTAEQIAAEIRRRPIGAVIADICRDLGIRCDHPLWRELSDLIRIHGGNLTALITDIITMPFQPPNRPARGSPEAQAPFWPAIPPKIPPPLVGGG
jgi:hypothetical protein